MIASAALFGSAIALPNSLSFPRRQDQGVCTTDVCKSYAELILSSRALNYADIDPCTDFATYTCGNWEANHPLGADEAGKLYTMLAKYEYSKMAADDMFLALDMFYVVQDVNTALLKTIMESPYPENTINSNYTGGDGPALDKQNFDKMVAAYNTCMDVDALNEAGAKPLQDLLDAYVAFSKNTTDLTDKMSWVLHYGGKFNSAGGRTASYGFVQAIPWADDAHPNVTTVALSPGLSGLSLSGYGDAETVANYTTAIAGMFDIVFAEEAHDSHVDLAGKIIALEKAIISVAPSRQDLTDPSYYYNSLPIAEADVLFPEVSFSRLIESFAPSDYTIDHVIVFSPSYFSQLSSIIKNSTAETLDAYLKWVLIQTWATYLSDAANAPYRRLKNELNGLDPEAASDRSSICLAHIDDNLPWIETAFYIRSAFSVESKTLGDQIVTDMRNLFETKLASNYTWMSAEVRTKAVQKVENMIQKIGYPAISPNTEDPTAIAEFYAAVNVSDSYFANGVAFNTFELNRTWGGLVLPRDKYYWVMTGPEVNANYVPSANDLTFPAGIMQSPFFNVELPDWANYGAFGSVAGHEVTHAFDNLGGQYDETGAYVEWWDNATLASFNEKAQCFVDEFANYTITGPDGSQLHVDGELTLSENIADSGGLSAAYTAWQTRKQTSGTTDQLLPGLEDYTTEQLFYMAFGNIWCGAFSPVYLADALTSDVHAPNKVRISGTVANQVGFREAFNCPSKVPTCELW